MSTPASSPRPTGTARTLLVVAGLVVAGQALALIAIALVEATAIDPSRVGLGVSTALFLGFFGVVLLVAVGRVLAGSSGARSGLVFAQLLCLGLSWNFRGDAWWITTVLAGSAVVAGACLLAPPVTRALNPDEGV